MLSLLLAMLPGWLHVRIRRLRGSDISPDARIGFGALLQVGSLSMGPGSRISGFSRIRAERATLGAEATVGSLVSIVAHEFELGDGGRISPMVIVSGDPHQDRSRLVIGRHSKVFPISWLDCDYGITMGDRVGIGGHGLIFTHGSWANRFLGAPVTFGAVHIGDRVWLPWRVFIMPGVTIGERAIIGAGSVVTKSIPDGALAAGSPAKVLRERAYQSLTPTELDDLVDEVVAHFHREVVAGFDILTAQPTQRSSHAGGSVWLAVDPDPAQVEAASGLGVGVIDVLGERAWAGVSTAATRELAAWLTRYGVRVDYC